MLSCSLWVAFTQQVTQTSTRPSTTFFEPAAPRERSLFILSKPTTSLLLSVGVLRCVGVLTLPHRLVKASATNKHRICALAYTSWKPQGGKVQWPELTSKGPMSCCEPFILWRKWGYGSLSNVRDTSAVREFKVPSVEQELSMYWHFHFCWNEKITLSHTHIYLWSIYGDTVE